MQLDWRNASVENIRATYAEPNSIHAALAMNEGSKAPDFYSGPIWAIFDRAAVERDKWNIDPPFTSPTNGFFFKADTIEELAAKIQEGHEFQRVPLTYLEETVAKWNSYVDKGSDPEFARGPDAPMHRIDTPPFYAATLYPVWHDSYGGLRINGRAQVIDMQGEPIPGLYAGGESSGGGNQHGLGTRPRPWLHRRHERRRGADNLIWKHRRRLPRSRLTGRVWSCGTYRQRLWRANDSGSKSGSSARTSATWRTRTLASMTRRERRSPRGRWLTSAGLARPAYLWRRSNLTRQRARAFTPGASRAQRAKAPPALASESSALPNAW